MTYDACWNRSNLQWRHWCSIKPLKRDYIHHWEKESGMVVKITPNWGLCSSLPWKSSIAKSLIFVTLNNSLYEALSISGVGLDWQSWSSRYGYLMARCMHTVLFCHPSRTARVYPCTLASAFLGRRHLFLNVIYVKPWYSPTNDRGRRLLLEAQGRWKYQLVNGWNKIR